jgi:hypothetical protein
MILAETVSDAVQITTLITTALGVAFAAYMSYKIAQLNRSQTDAAGKVEQVRERLRQTTFDSGNKLDELSEVTRETLKRVDGDKKHLLQTMAISARTLAIITNEKGHRQAADDAEAALAAHIETDNQIIAGKWPVIAVEAFPKENERDAEPT